MRKNWKKANELSLKGMNNKKGTLFKRTHIWNY